MNINIMSSAKHSSIDKRIGMIATGRDIPSSMGHGPIAMPKTISSIDHNTGEHSRAVKEIHDGLTN